MTERETFESGAERDVLPVRYDLCSPVAVESIMSLQEFDHEGRGLLQALFCGHQLLWPLIAIVEHRTGRRLLDAMYYILEAYARTMHEGAAKYGPRVWEKGIPEDNLRNHAIHHLVKLIGGDTSEPHLDHLIWNVLTIIHFREKEKGEGND